MKQILAISLLIILAGCSTTYPNRSPINEAFPQAIGNSLAREEVSIPKDFAGKKALLLLGYVQDSQFDIDRWLIGLDMTKTKVNVFEIPTIQGFFPRLISNQIDGGMRKGIPEDLWKVVITVYEDGDKIQKFTGNTNPRNARVVLLDESGGVIFFHDRGFSVSALNAVREKI